MAKRKSPVIEGAKRLERGLSKSGQRLARAVELGVENWQRRSRKSARQRRDGALRSVLQNSAFAAGTAVREASWATSDLMRALGRRDPRRLFLRALLPR